ncbi:MAG: fimbrillin family protein [Treponema sp.]|jgi:hypothetical protein|nr:fimbrillin family protein [Treponema sp.]
MDRENSGKQRPRGATPAALGACLGAVLAGACAQGWEAPPVSGLSQEGAIIFAITIGEAETGGRLATAGDFTSAWEEGDQAVVFAVSRPSASPSGLAPEGNYLNNETLTRGGSAWSYSLSSPYFPQNGNVLDFYAYYPRQAGAANPGGIAFSVQADQDAAGNYSKSSLLTARQTGVAKTSNAVPLSFAHAVALVQVTVTNSGDNTRLTLRNVRTRGALDLGAGTLSLDNNSLGSIKMLRFEQGPPGVFRALAPPQALNGAYIEAEHDGKRYAYPIDPAITLQAGKAARLSITI